MKHTFAVMILGSALTIPAGAMAQPPAPVRSIELTIIPGGVTIFTESNDTGEPSFTNYDAGAAIAVNLNDRFSVEGEMSGAFGLSQRLQFASREQEVTTPNLLHYTGNVAVALTTQWVVVPFVTAGAGGLIVFERADVIQRQNTFFASNVGGGVKWRTGRWGIRADYRFTRIEGQDTPFAPNERPVPDFFGKDTRYAHRLFGGIVIGLD